VNLKDLEENYSNILPEELRKENEKPSQDNRWLG